MPSPLRGLRGQGPLAFDTWLAECWVSAWDYTCRSLSGRTHRLLSRDPLAKLSTHTAQQVAGRLQQLPWLPWLPGCGRMGRNPLLRILPSDTPVGSAKTWVRQGAGARPGTQAVHACACMCIHVFVWGHGGDHGSWSSSELPEGTMAGCLKGLGQLPSPNPGQMTQLSPTEGAGGIF